MKRERGQERKGGSPEGLVVQICSQFKRVGVSCRRQIFHERVSSLSVSAFRVWASEMICGLVSGRLSCVCEQALVAFLASEHGVAGITLR